MKARAETVRDVGACVSPMNSFLLIQGLETLSLRMERHVGNRRSGSPSSSSRHAAVAWVAYAGLPSHPDHALAQKYLPKGPGAVFSFGLKGARARRCARTARNSSRRSSFSRTWPTSATCAASSFTRPRPPTSSFPTRNWRSAASGPEMIRLSVGLENVEDLLWDLDQAFHALSRSTRA